MPIRVMEIKTVPWESQGVARPPGTRYFQPGEEPPAEHFNHHFWSNYADIEALARYIDDHALARFIRPDEFALIGDPPASMVVIGESYIPALAFPNGAISKAKTYIRNVVPTGENVNVTLWWTCPISTTGTAVWEIRYGQFMEGQPINITTTTYQRIVGTGGAAWNLVATSFVMEGLVQGRPMLIELVRNGLHPSDTIAAPLYALFVEVR
ncbi:MAG: hypothetical protein QXU79_00040 [Candidatus Micrarchaeaceae archaeon]